jgi:hypothetical protein
MQFNLARRLRRENAPTNQVRSPLIALCGIGTIFSRPAEVMPGLMAQSLFRRPDQGRISCIKRARIGPATKCPRNRSDACVV